MDIIINKVRGIDDEKQVVFFTLTKDTVEYLNKSNTPILSGAELQSWLDAKIDFYWYSILHNEYPEAPPQHRQSLADMEAWIAAGAKYREKTGQDENGNDTYGPEKTAKKKPWKGKHPPIIDLKDRYTAANSVAQKIDIIAEMLELE